MFLNPSLFQLPESEVKLYGLENLTYGSLTKRGLQTLVGSINAFAKKYPIYGLDLGCGDGELIYNLGQSIPDSIWEGVEISNHRVKAQKRDVYIWQGDMLEETYRPYNLLHADNLCLEDHIADALEQKIAREFCGLYITYRFPQDLEFLQRAEYLGTVKTETTWTVHPIHYFRLH